MLRLNGVDPAGELLFFLVQLGDFFLELSWILSWMIFTREEDSIAS